MALNGIKFQGDDAAWKREVERIIAQQQKDINYLKSQILILTKKVA
jgi:hypothetical protein